MRGGARPGSGPKKGVPRLPKPKVEKVHLTPPGAPTAAAVLKAKGATPQQKVTALGFLQHSYNNDELPWGDRYRAALAAIPFEVAKPEPVKAVPPVEEVPNAELYAPRQVKGFGVVEGGR